MLRERLTAQAVSGSRLTSVEEVVGRILAVQAQDTRGARLAIRVRSRGLSAAEVDRALTDRRSVVIATLNRGTLHLVLAEDFHWLHALTTPQLVNSNLTRLGQEGLTPEAAERGADLIASALAAEGPLTRAALRQLVEEAGIRTEGQAFAQLLYFVAIRGLVLRGPVIGAEPAFALTEDWIGPPPAGGIDRDRALATLADRYLAGHGPGAPEDLAKWAGITLGDSRAAMAANADRLAERPDGLFDRIGRSAPARPPRLRLLGPFDPTLHGWASRDFVIPAEHDGRAVTSNGIFRPTILVNGRVKGTWALRRGKVELDPFNPLTEPELQAADREAQTIRRFLDG